MMTDTISKIKAELKKVEDAYFYNVYEKQQITNLTKALSVAVESLGLIERAYPLSGERMAHQDHAKTKLKTIANILSGGKDGK